MATREPARSESFPIRTVSAMTGVNPVTLRAWERRYGLVQPARTDTGHRLYSRDDVELLRRVVRLLERGVPIGRVAPMLERDDERSSTDAPGEALDDDGVWEDYRQRLLEAVAGFDEPLLNAVYNEALSLYPLDVVSQRLVLPALARLGARWRLRDDGVAQEHFFSTYLRNKLGARLHHLSLAARGPRLLAACLPGERHELGLLMFALAASGHGYRVVMLGADMPFDGLPSAVDATGARAVVLSASCDPAPDAIEALERTAATLAVPVLVGGRLGDEARDRLAASPIVDLGSEFAAALGRLDELLDFDAGRALA